MKVRLKRLSVSAQAYKADSTVHTAGGSIMQLCECTLSVLKETLTSHSVQSDEVHECSKAQKCSTKSDEERLLIYRINIANMASKRR